MMRFDRFDIGAQSRPFIIAEMSGNHNQSGDRALAIVDAAGAHAIKRQSDTTTLTLDEGEFFISDPRSPWVGQSTHVLSGQADTLWEWHAPILERAASKGRICFSSPFDESALDVLDCDA